MQTMTKADLLLTVQFLAFYAFTVAVAGMVGWTMGDLLVRDVRAWWWVTLPAFALIGIVWWVLVRVWQMAPGNKNLAALMALLIVMLVLPVLKWWLY